MDLVTETDRLPNQGETIFGEAFQTSPGGKGANQAVAAARLGAPVQMIGAVGADLNGTVLLDVLEKENVSTSMVQAVPNIQTGVANIIVSNKDNRIIVVPGANKEVTPEYVGQFKSEILKSDIVLMQFEIPVETVLYCLNLCKEHDIPIVINPAPAKKIAPEYWQKATYITPNESEAALLFDVKQVRSFLNRKLVITEGERGVSYGISNDRVHVPAHAVDVVDTTGAGDTFNGALAVALVDNRTIDEAVIFANAASALSIQKVGAQAGMPNRTMVEEFLKSSL